MRRLVSCLLVLWATAASAAVPTPESVLGFTPGADRTLADWRQIVVYFQALDEASPRVTVEAGRNGAGPFVRVIDNGPGVNARIKPRLFEPFVTGRSNGVGIGLALSRRIARAHGGDLRLVEGTRETAFELTLPGDAA